MKNLSQLFGNKKVLKSQKTDLVQNIFSKISTKYNLMNDLMSFGTNRLWKRRLIEMINIQDNQTIIDVGAGTGDIGLKISSMNKKANIFLGDLNLSMIELGMKNKYLKNKNVKWINMNSEAMPFNNNSFDKYIISFCLRNVTDINKTLKESLRVLREGGEFFCLEFSTVDSPVLNNIYSTYKNNFIPLLGEYITSQKNAYKYLSESINNFPNQEILSGKLAKTGYKEISYNNLFGGIVSIHKGWKI